ncbi:ribosomal-protein-alanine N-acetyltransferase [Devosia sp. UYZn731]|uniref:GNAT family N-acetyltransferase n=1 Tax=Devosia sp. UYZn731 TaxID=3156345 RepID=UPI003391EA92
MITVPVLETNGFILRPLQVTDVTQRYLSWFSGARAQHIVASATTRTLEDLQAYVIDKLARPEVVFFGIFSRDTGLHIGNVKFEPVDQQAGYAVFGIFIGDADFRGRGVAAEVIAATAVWLKQLGIAQILLGVDAENKAAVRAYEKAGFVVGKTPHLDEQAGVHRMIMRL